MGYKTQSIEGIFDDFNFKGLSLKASKSISDSGAFVFGEYYAVEHSSSNTFGDVISEFESDIRQYEIGLGYKYSVTNKSDLFAEFAYGNTDIEAKDTQENTVDSNLTFVTESRVDNDFYRLGVGGRSQIYTQFEVFAKADFVKYSEGDGDIGWTIGGRYNITKQFDAEVSIYNVDESKSWFVGLSYRF